MSGLGHVKVESKADCEFCHENRELRPYGPKGELICFECMMEDEKTAKHQASRYLFGESIN